MKIAVIPARGGSKRISRKNIKLFSGKPMIGWSIEAAKSSGCFDEIIVSTDDQEIADIAQNYGATVPFLRPSELSDDFASMLDVMAHIADYLSNAHSEVEYICCIFATAPLLDPKSILDGLHLVQESDSKYSMSVGQYSTPIQRALRLEPDKRVEMFQPEYFHMRSQDLENAYFDAGQFYWGKTESWLNKEFLFSPATRAVLVESIRVQDIDTEEDWVMAELKLDRLKHQNSRV